MTSPASSGKTKTPLQLSLSGYRCNFHYSRVRTQIVCSDEDNLFLASYIICCRVFASSQTNIGQFLSHKLEPKCPTLIRLPAPLSHPKQLSLGTKKDPINKAHVFKDTFQRVYMSVGNVRHTCIGTKVFFII